MLSDGDGWRGVGDGFLVPGAGCRVLGAGWLGIGDGPRATGEG